MIHAAARGEPYACFVRGEVRIPFMAMPDAVRALLLVSSAQREALTRTVYNVTSFSLSAKQIRDRVLAAFPDADISFEPDLKREAIVDSWPADVDDSAARLDWGWSPEYDVERAFDEYLIPAIQRHYEAIRSVRRASHPPCRASVRSRAQTVLDGLLEFNSSICRMSGSCRLPYWSTARTEAAQAAWSAPSTGTPSLWTCYG